MILQNREYSGFGMNADVGAGGTQCLDVSGTNAQTEVS